MNKPELNAIVAKANTLIGELAKFDLSELRLIAYCLAYQNSNKADNRTITAKVEDLTNIFPMNTKNAYAVIRKAMLGIARKPLEFKEGKKAKLRHWFSGFDYTENTGTFDFTISAEAQPYLLQLQGNFTQYRLEDVYQFRAASTWKMYELLKRWATTKKWEVELDKLRQLMGITGKYPAWGNLSRRVIIPTIKEINSTSDLHVTYTLIKQLRKIHSIKFNIQPKPNKPRKIIDITPPEEQLYQALTQCGINPKTATKYQEIALMRGKTTIILDKLPGIIERSTGNETPQRYILGSISNEINGQQDLPIPKTTPAKQKAFFESRKKMSSEYLQIEADKGCQTCQQVLDERKREKK